MASYHHPEYKKFSQSEIGELLTVLYDQGHRDGLKIFGIVVKLPRSKALMALSIIGRSRTLSVPMVFPFEQQDRLCASYGTDFQIESTTPPLELIDDIDIQKGCIVHTADRKFIACHHAHAGHTTCIALPDFTYMDVPSYGTETVQFPKWRVTTPIKAASELICLGSIEVSPQQV